MRSSEESSSFSAASPSAGAADFSLGQMMMASTPVNSHATVPMRKPGTMLVRNWVPMMVPTDWPTVAPPP